MKKLLLLLTVLLFMALPSFAQAKAGQRDNTFGRNGEVVDVLGSKSTPIEADSFHFARIPGGRFVVLTRNTLIEYLSDGKRNPDFGTDGEVQIEAPTAAELKLVDVAVDSRGRILVAGTVGWASAFVARYQLQGERDQSFGLDGTVVTDLGLPAPPPPPNKGIAPTPAGTEPVVRVLGLAVDEGDRPLLTGGWVSDYQFCYPFIYDTPKETGYVARLGVDGSIDPSFGGDGVVVPDPAKEVATSPIVAGGIVSIGALAAPGCLRGAPNKPEATRVGQRGGVAKRFGSGGLVSLPFWIPPKVTRDRFGRILLLGPTEEGANWTLQRLTPTGGLERHFGHHGKVDLPADSGSDALATDHRGRVILAGSDGPVLLVDRRKRNGRVDRSFGEHGEIESLFPGELELSQNQILVGDGRILVGGTWVNDGKYGVAFARFLGR
jgi:uncharacterized delta-60 repeat protein